MGRTEGAIHKLLSLQKTKTGIAYPKLRHANLKYDKETIAKWRKAVRETRQTYKKTAAALGVHPVILCDRLAREVRGELAH